MQAAARAPKEPPGDVEDEAVSAIGEKGRAVRTPLPGPLPAGRAFDSSPGKTLPAPLLFANDGIVARNRQGRMRELRSVVEDTLKKKWSEANTGPTEPLIAKLQGGDTEFRKKLLEAQTACDETLELVKACRRTLAGEGVNNRSGEPAEDSRGGSKDYRLNPCDGVLERHVAITKAIIWVPVMPTTVSYTHLTLPTKA